MRLALMPVLFPARLVLGLLAFITTVASQIIGWTFSIFLLLAIMLYCTNNTLNGHIALGFALLVSPLGLPLIMNLILQLLDRVLGFFERTLC